MADPHQQQQRTAGFRTYELSQFATRRAVSNPSELRVIDVPGSKCRFTLGPDCIKRRSVRDHFRIVAVRMIEARRGLVVPVRRGLRHRAFGAPVRGAVGAAARIDVPYTALTGRARTRARVVPAERS